MGLKDVIDKMMSGRREAGCIQNKFFSKSKCYCFDFNVL